MPTKNKKRSEMNSAYATYNQNNAQVESPQKLVLMLYEGILRFVARAKKAIEDKDIEQKVLFCNKTMAIFFELMNSLDMKQGQISQYLQGMYARQIQVILKASLENDSDMLDEVIKVTRGMIDAWKEVTQEDELA
nr:flagellar export chaperone FliS [Campylobacter sp.]